MTSMILGAISQGHTDLADFLFLIAFIVFIVGCIIVVITKPVALVQLALYVGLALLSLAWFVL